MRCVVCGIVYHVIRGIVQVLLPSSCWRHHLCWHHCPCCAGVVTLIVLSFSPLHTGIVVIVVLLQLLSSHWHLCCCCAGIFAVIELALCVGVVALITLMLLPILPTRLALQLKRRTSSSARAHAGGLYSCSLI